MPFQEARGLMRCFPRCSLVVYDLHSADLQDVENVIKELKALLDHLLNEIS